MSELKVNEAYQSFLTAKAASERLSHSDERDVEVLKMLIKEAAADGKFSISKSGLSDPVILHIQKLGYQVELNPGAYSKTTGLTWDILWKMATENE
jgi:hypothetical protein